MRIPVLLPPDDSIGFQIASAEGFGDGGEDLQADKPFAC
jgi:hypothetical protein